MRVPRWGLCLFVVAALTIYWMDALGLFDRPSARRYTCAEVLGSPPRPGFWRMIPPGWMVQQSITLTGQPVPDFRVWDDHNRLVCDAQGHDRVEDSAKRVPL